MRRLGLALMAGMAISVSSISISAAQDGAATVQVMQNEQLGEILTDGEGRVLYLFTDDTQGSGGTAPTVSCSGGCLENWPPLFTEGDPQAGEGVDASLLSTVSFNDKMMVTYNGWPLYYFAGDEQPGQTNGQERGDKWYVVNAAGEAVHSD